MDPFYSECRAYRRLIKNKLNGKVAVRCHGYLILPAKKEEELRRAFNVDNWQRHDNEYSTPASKRKPFRAIVEDLVTEGCFFRTEGPKDVERSEKDPKTWGLSHGHCSAELQGRPTSRLQRRNDEATLSVRYKAASPSENLQAGRSTFI